MCSDNNSRLNLADLLLTRESFTPMARLIARTRIFPVDYPGVERLLDDLEEVLPSRDDVPVLHGKTCAVVGNGDVLLRRPFGDEIDAHDIVVRINRIDLDSYRIHTGARTSLHLVNEPRGHAIVRGEYRPHGEATIFCGPSNEHHAWENYLTGLRRGTAGRAFLMHPVVRLEIGEFHPRFPSAGFIAACLARRMELHIDLYGYNIDGNPKRIFGPLTTWHIYHQADVEYGMYDAWQSERFRVVI